MTDPFTVYRPVGLLPGEELAASSTGADLVRGIIRGSTRIARHADWSKLDLRAGIATVFVLGVGAGVAGTTAVMKARERRAVHLGGGAPAPDAASDAILQVQAPTEREFRLP